MDTVTVLSREEILVTRVADRLGLVRSTARSPHKSLPELCPLVRELGLGKDCWGEGSRGREFLPWAGEGRQVSWVRQALKQRKEEGQR